MTPNKIAVTGGLGSGKSAFCAVLRKMGFPVFSCDEINRELWTDEAYRHALADAFPDCLTNGAVDRTKLSAKVFSDERARDALNALSHPQIMHRLIGRMEACSGPVFAEVPLLYEGGYEGLFDAVIALHRDKEARIAAVKTRDGLSADQALARMRGQFDPERLVQKRCLIVENDGGLDALSEKAAEALRTLGIR